MINYRLRCEATHDFEGWFRSSSDYDEQAKKGLLTCPFCGSEKVEKAIMAPAITRHAKAPEALPAPQETNASNKENSAKSPKEPAQETLPTVKAPSLPEKPPSQEQVAQFWQMARKLQQHVETHFENVGKEFPQEVRKMHLGETDKREVYGEATLEDAKDLLEEGIDILPLPRLPKLDG